MTPGAWVALLTTGCFISLSSFANGAFPAPKARTFAEKQAMAARMIVEPVRLWKRDAKAELLQMQAEVYRAVYHITPENQNSDIFGGDQ